MTGFNRIFPFAAGIQRQQVQAGALSGMREQLYELQRQITTGQKAKTYGELGSDRVTSLFVRNQLGVTQGYQQVVDLTTIRLKMMDQSTSELNSIASTARTTLLKSRGTNNDADMATAKQQVQSAFDQMISTLNRQVAGLYLYSGRTRDVKPVLDSTTIINGDGVNAGLRQVVDERRQADFGTGNGRMVTSVTGSTVAWGEDAVGNPFGIKLVPGSVSGTLSSAAITGPAVAPNTLSVNFTGQPTSGERMTVTVKLPDGTTKTLGFAADKASSADDSVFAIGATPADTANNLKAAIDNKLASLAGGELREASSLMATREFFSGSRTNPPPRVAGPPFASSIGYAAAGTRPTVIWYQGDDDASIAARDTQKAEVDTATSVSFGARASEGAFRDTLAAFATVLVEDYPVGLVSSRERFDAAAGRALNLLNSTGGPDAILGVNAEFGTTMGQIKSISEVHKNATLFLNGLIDGVESANKESLALQLTALQTQLEAAYQTTATLSKLSLTNYI